MQTYFFLKAFNSYIQYLDCRLYIKSSKANTPLGFPSHSTSLDRDWNELHKTPTGQINLFLFLRQPSETLIQMHAIALQFNNYPDSHRAVSLLVLFRLN